MVSARLLDTNLLLLWLVSRVNLNMIARFKRVQSFDREDAALLNSLIGNAPMVTTPHVLAEVSNFVRQAPSDGRPLLIEAFRRFAMDHAEIYEEAKLLARSTVFTSYGLADAAIFHLAAQQHVITVDYRLAGQIQAAGFEVTNFNHVRAASYRAGR